MKLNTKKNTDLAKQFLSNKLIYFKQSNQKRKLIFIALAVIVILFLTSSITGIFKNKSTDSKTSRTNDKRANILSAKSTNTIDKTFTFPLKDDKNAEVAKFKYIIGDVQLQDEIIVKGQRATAVKGRTFLIVNLKIINDSSHTFDINTRDYIRLSIESNNERFAADIHNDPVQIQAISTKPTRLGFPINDTNKKFTLYVGEIKGEKKSIDINLK